MTRSRMSRSAPSAVWAAAIVVAALGLAIPATTVAGLPAVDPPSYNVESDTQLIGTPKHYELAMSASSDSIVVQMQRTATAGNKPVQQHIYAIANAQLTCASDLSSCDLSDNDALGPLGRIDLAFSPNGPTQTSKLRCNDGTVFAVEKTRMGTLGGIFRIRTHTGYFGVIQNKGSTGVHVPSALPAHVTKTIYKNVMCVNVVAAGTDQCFNTLTVVGQGDEIGFASRGGEFPQAFVELGYKDSDGTDTVQLAHAVVAYVAKKFVRETSSDPQPLEEVKINFDALAPFAGGTGRFDPTDLPEFEGDSCNTTYRDGNLNGAFSAKFDGWGVHEFSAIPAQARKTTAN